MHLYDDIFRADLTMMSIQFCRPSTALDAGRCGRMHLPSGIDRNITKAGFISPGNFCKWWGIRQWKQSQGKEISFPVMYSRQTGMEIPLGRRSIWCSKRKSGHSREKTREGYIMGCDIHIITQIKKDGHWQYIPEKPESYDCRCYPVFAFLAQVRGCCENGFMPRGLPEDLGETRYGQWIDSNGDICYDIDFNYSDWHSHSYLTLKEIDEKLRANAPAEKPVHVSKQFLDAFFSHGGELPYGMEILKKDKAGADIIWDSGLECYATLCEGRGELVKIAHKYGVSPEYIRIVFAFDS